MNKVAEFDGLNYRVDGKILTPDQLKVIQLEAEVRLLKSVVVQNNMPDTEVTIPLHDTGIGFTYDESPFDNVITVKWRRVVVVN